MKVIIFGATGMLGQGVLRESLRADDVEQVVTVVRKPTGIQHRKLREVTLADFADLNPIESQLQDIDAYFYCIGLPQWSRMKCFTPGSTTSSRRPPRGPWPGSIRT